MKWFTRLRHWQVFIILFVGPIAVSIIDLPGPTKLKAFSNLGAFTLYVLWVWCVGLAVSQSKDVKRLFCAFMLILCFMVATIIVPNDNGALRIIFTALTYILLLLYALMTGRLLSQAEGHTRLRHSFMNSLLLIVYPVGVWIIQPRVNKYG